MFENDWMVANLNNPNMDMADLTSIGELNTKNTQFLKKEDYLKSNFIKNNAAFKDENGNFSLQKFDNFYNYQASQWNKLLQGEFPKGLKLDPFDTAANKRTSRVKPLTMNIGRTDNPDRVQIGIEGIRTKSDRTKSVAELAQSQKIFNPESGKYEEYTPDDISLFSSPTQFIKNIFSDPLVIASYDEDTVDELGNKHKKGDYKLNDLGTYYYERLNGRSAGNKLTLSFLDILTPEGSALNKIDFFDSDDLQKSTAGVIAKNVAFMVPMFLGGPVASMYSSAIIAKEMAKTLPMLYNVSTGIFGDNSSTPEWMETLAAKADLFSGGTSEASKANMWNLENFANLATDVVLQWGQQKQIAKTISKLLDDSSVKNAEKLAFELYKRKAKDPKFISIAAQTESEWKNSQLGLMALKLYVEPAIEAFRSKQLLGADVSLAYMSLISNTDVYQDMIDKGATKKEAAWVTLGSTLGMFGVDKYGHIGELFFDELADHTALDIAKAIGSKKSLRGEVKSAIEEYGYLSALDIKGKSAKELFRRGLNIGKNLTERFYEGLKNHNLGGFGKALGEGLEEVSEELVTDTAKGMYSLLGDLGLYDPSVKNAVDFDTMAERYAMSFIGGAFGGGLFYAKERFTNEYQKPAERDLILLIRDGKADQIRNKVYELRDKGDLGSTTLSGLNYTTDSESSTPTWLSTDAKTESQNDVIARRILEKVDLIESILSTNGANLNDDELFDNMVLSELRYQRYKNASYITGYYHEFKKLSELLVLAESQLKKAQKTKDGTPTGELMKDSDRETPEKQLNLALLLAKVDQIKQKMSDHLSGDTSLEYTRKLMFALDPTLNDAFLDLNYMDWVIKNHPEKLDPTYEATFEDLIKMAKEWNEHVKETMTLNLDSAWDLYKTIEQGISPELLNLQDSSGNYLETLQILEEIRLNPDKYNWSGYFSKDENKILTENDRLINDDGTLESDDEYNARNDIYLDEDSDRPIEERRFDLDKLARKRLRQLKILQYNEAKIQGFIKQYTDLLSRVGYKVDTATARAIRQNIAINLSNVMRDIYLQPKINADGSVAFNPAPYINVMEDLKEDGSNISDIKSRATKIWRELAKENIKLAFNVLDAVGFDEDNEKHLINVIRRPIDLLGVKKSLKDLGLNQTLLDAYDLLKKEGDNVLNSSPSDDDIFLSEGQILELEDAGLALTEDLKNALKDEDSDGILLTETQLNYLKNSVASKLKDFFSDKNTLANDTEKKHLVELNTSQMTRSDFIKKILNKDNTGFFDISAKGSFGNNYTLLQLLEELETNTKGVGDKISLIAPEMMTPTEDGTPLLTAWLKQYQFLQGKDTKLFYFSQKNNVVDPDSKTQQLQLEAINNYIDDVVNQIQNHPLNKLLTNLKTDVKSPLLKIFEKVAQEVAKDKHDLFNIEKLLNNVYLEYIDSELGSFLLNGEEANQLSIAKNILKLVLGYIYSTSTQEDANHPFGHNLQINKFAEEHSDKLQKPWNKLVELNSQYQGILFRELSNLLDEISIWETISANNGINKAKRIAQTDSATKKVKYNLLKELSATFTIDGLKLFETPLPDVAEPTMKDVALAELKLFNSFAKYLHDSGLNAELFFEKTDFWNKFFKGNKNINLKTSVLHPSLNEFTDFTKAIYIAKLLSINPIELYTGIKNFLTDNPDVAPIPTQQELITAGIAVMSPVFLAAMDSLADYTGAEVYRATSSNYINGVAGAGKTDIVLKAIRQYYHKKKALIIGPTQKLANKLATLLGEAKSYTIQDDDTNIFKLIVVNYDKLNIDGLIHQFNDWFNNTPLANTKQKSFKNAYVTITYNAGNINIEFSDKVKFNDTFNQQLIFVDEAAHLNTILLALLNELARKNKGVAYFASDSTQNGYLNGRFENIDVDSMFIARSPKLLESLRSDNILKLDNDAKIQTLIDSGVDLYTGNDESAKKAFEQQLPDLCKKMKLRSYIGENSITGDIFKADLDELIPKMVPNSEVGYIGAETDPTFIKLKNAGFKVKAFDKKSVQGQEFDYVVIGSLGIDTITPDYKGLLALKDIYTLMTRGKKAAIWIDDLKPLFGEPQEDTITSKGFSILDLLDNFKQQFNTEFNQIDLSDKTKLPKVTETTDSTVIEEESTEEEPTPEVAPEEEALTWLENNTDLQNIINELDFDNNYYLIHQTNPENFDSIKREGFRINAPTLLGTTNVLGNVDQLRLLLVDMRAHGGAHHGSKGLIIFKFPKNHPGYEGKPARTTLDISEGPLMWDSLEKGSIVEGKDVNKYIEYMIDVTQNGVTTNDVEHSEAESSETDPTTSEEETSVETINNKEAEQIRQVFEENIETEAQSREPETISLNFGDYSIEANTVMPMTGFIKEKRTIDGKDTYVWIVPKEDDSGIKRNMNAFYRGDSGEISDWEEKRQIQEMISSIQSAVLFGDSAFDTLNASIRGFNGMAQAWNNRQMLFEIRKATEVDNFGYGTDLKDTFIEIDGEKYVISLVLKLPGLLTSSDSDEFDAYIDIALLNDPKTLAKHVKDGSIKASLQGNTDPKVQHFVANLEEISDLYSQFIKDAVKSEQILNNGRLEVVLSDDDWSSHGTTRLVETKNKRRLGGLINPDALSGSVYNRKGLKIDIAYEDGQLTDESRKALVNHGSFMDIDSRNVVSDVYILTDKSRKLKGVSEDIIGKAVVFVTSDKNLNRDNLAQEYFNLKNDPDNHTPRVRMVVLNNHGLSFSELYTHHISKYLSGESSENSRPWNMKTMGIRMFTAMWNFRASLKNMQSAYIDLLKEIAGSEEDKALAKARIEIEKALKVESLRYRIGKLQEEIKTDTSEKAAKRKLLADLNLELSAIKNINEDIVLRVLKFNEEDLLDVPTVRLGYAFNNYKGGSIGRGFVRSFNVEKSSRYDLTQPKYKGRKTVNMYAMNIDTMEHWLHYLDTILNLIAKNSEGPVFNNAGKQISDVTEAFGITVLDTNTKESLKPNLYILKSNSNRNLSGVIKTEYVQNGPNKSERVKFDDGFEYELSADGKFGFVPKLLGDMVFKVRGKSKRLTKKHLKNPLARITSDINFLTKDADGEDVLKSLKFDFEALFKSDFDESDVSDELTDLLNVVFHGSTQNITGLDKNGISRGHAFTDDAIYKYGMFVDPEMTSGKPETINIGGNADKQEYVFLKCRINPMLFDVNVKAIPGGAVVNMARIIEAVTGKKVDKTDISPTPIKARYKIGDKLNVLSSTGSLDNAFVINGIMDTKYGARYTATNLNDGSRITLSVSDVDNNLRKYKLQGDNSLNGVDLNNLESMKAYLSHIGLPWDYVKTLDTTLVSDRQYIIKGIKTMLDEGRSFEDIENTGFDTLVKIGMNGIVPDNLSYTEAAQLLVSLIEKAIEDLTTRSNSNKYNSLITKLGHMTQLLQESSLNGTEVNIDALSKQLTLIMEEVNNLDAEPDLSFVEPLFFEDFKSEFDNGNVEPTEKAYKKYIKNYEKKFLQGLFINGKYAQTEDEEGDAVDDPETDLKLLNYFAEESFDRFEVIGSGESAKIRGFKGDTYVEYSLSDTHELIRTANGLDINDTLGVWSELIAGGDGMSYADYKDGLALVYNLLNLDRSNTANIAFILNLLKEDLELFKDEIESCDLEKLIEIIENIPNNNMLTDDLKNQLIDNLEFITSC